MLLAFLGDILALRLAVGTRSRPKQPLICVLCRLTSQVLLCLSVSSLVSCYLRAPLLVMNSCPYNKNRHNKNNNVKNYGYCINNYSRKAFTITVADFILMQAEWRLSYSQKRRLNFKVPRIHQLSDGFIITSPELKHPPPDPLRYFILGGKGVFNILLVLLLLIRLFLLLLLRLLLLLLRRLLLLLLLLLQLQYSFIIIIMIITIVIIVITKRMIFFIIV